MQQRHDLHHYYESLHINHVRYYSMWYYCSSVSNDHSLYYYLVLVLVIIINCLHIENIFIRKYQSKYYIL